MSCSREGATMQNREKHCLGIVRSCCSKMIRKILKHNWIKISILAGLCLLFYTVTTKHMPKDMYKTEDLLGPLYSIIKNNGKILIDDLPSLSYHSDAVKYRVMNELRNSVKKLVKLCTDKDRTVCKANKQEQEDNSAILTLFTTWIYDKDKFYINNNTLQNWKNLEKVNLVIFSDDKEVVYYGKQAGWEIMPVTQQAAGAPVLPVMFKEVMSKFSSKFYGYANGDLLFTESLTKTLEAVLCHQALNANSQGVLVVGKRVNVPSAMIKDRAVSSGSLEQLAVEHGTLFQPDAEDYFVTDRKFPWHSFLPLAVGRTGYDNWVVTFARLKNVMVVDATDTVLCIHQTMESRGNYEGHTKGEFNVEMIEKLGLPIPVFKWGKTFCAEMKSAYDLCDNVNVIGRPSLPQECIKTDWSHVVMKAIGFSNNTISL